MKKTIYLMLTILSSSMLMQSCKNTTPKVEESAPQAEVAEVRTFQTVGLPEFKETLADSSIIVLDVRTAEEHAEGCIPGTDYNFDVLQADFIENIKATVTEGSTLAIYCRSGNRSKKAAKLLVDNGYHVIELGTGYKGWKAAEQE